MENNNKKETKVMIIGMLILILVVIILSVTMIWGYNSSITDYISKVKYSYDRMDYHRDQMYAELAISPISAKMYIENDILPELDMFERQGQHGVPDTFIDLNYDYLSSLRKMYIGYFEIKNYISEYIEVEPYITEAQLQDFIDSNETLKEGLEYVNTGIEISVDVEFQIYEYEENNK